MHQQMMECVMEVVMYRERGVMVPTEPVIFDWDDPEYQEWLEMKEEAEVEELEWR